MHMKKNITFREIGDVVTMYQTWATTQMETFVDGPKYVVKDWLILVLILIVIVILILIY